MRRYELHPPHLINVATLPCETRNSKNVIIQWDITKENCIKRIIYASSKWTGAQPRFQSWGVQFLGLGYCTERNTGGIPSFVDCSLLRNGNHTLHQKSWGGPSKFWRGPDPPHLPTSGCALVMGLGGFAEWVKKVHRYRLLH